MFFFIVRCSLQKMFKKIILHFTAHFYFYEWNIFSIFLINLQCVIWDEIFKSVWRNLIFELIQCPQSGVWACKRNTSISFIDILWKDFLHVNESVILLLKKTCSLNKRHLIWGVFYIFVYVVKERQLIF